MHVFTASLRRLAGFCEIGVDAAEGAVLGLTVSVFFAWTWPYPPPAFAQDADRLDWALGCAGAGAALGALRSWLARRRRRGRGEGEEG